MLKLFNGAVALLLGALYLVKAKAVKDYKDAHFHCSARDSCLPLMVKGPVNRHWQVGTARLCHRISKKLLKIGQKIAQKFRKVAQNVAQNAKSCSKVALYFIFNTTRLRKKQF